jgi:hypothetical protein
MIFAAVHYRDARLSAHEPVQDLFSNRSNAGNAQSLVDNRGDDGHRLRPADEWILEFIRVHSHGTCPGQRDDQPNCAKGGAEVPEL